MDAAAAFPPSNGGGPPGPAPPAIPNLPPQMFTTAASLLDLTDKKLMITLRDGTKYIGVLRSWDQYGNLLLSATVERIFAITASAPPRHIYADVPKGAFLVRGENIVLMGEIDLDRDDVDSGVPAPWTLADESEVFEARRLERERAQKRWKSSRAQLQFVEGFEGENNDEALT